MALIGLGRGESVEYSPLIYGLVGGPLITALPSILWRKALLITDNLELSILMYLTPLISLIWLLSLSLIGDVDVTLLAFGAVVIVAANVGVYLDGRQPRGAPEPMVSTKSIIKGGESGTVEFKSSFRMNLHSSRVEKRFNMTASRARIR